MTVMETRMMAMGREKTATREGDMEMEINCLDTPIMDMWMKVLGTQGLTFNVNNPS